MGVEPEEMLKENGVAAEGRIENTDTENTLDAKERKRNG